MMMKTEKETIDFLIECGNVYYNTGDVIIPDSEYDELYRNAQLTWPNNPFFQQIGAPVRGSEIKHTNQIGGLEQVHEGELEKWKSRTNYANEDLLISDEDSQVTSLPVIFVASVQKSLLVLLLNLIMLQNGLAFQTSHRLKSDW